MPFVSLLGSVLLVFCHLLTPCKNVLALFLALSPPPHKPQCRADSSCLINTCWDESAFQLQNTSVLSRPAVSASLVLSDVSETCPCCSLQNPCSQQNPEAQEPPNWTVSRWGDPTGALLGDRYLFTSLDCYGVEKNPWILTCTVSSAQPSLSPQPKGDPPSTHVSQTSAYLSSAPPVR